MNETFIIYLWQFQYFSKADLRTTDGEVITILHPGTHNPYSGPDFTQARIRIGDVEWVGNVEIHVLASAWMDHKHHFDKSYDTVVLHVVWKNDRTITRLDGSYIPVLELQHKVDPALVLDFRSLINSPEHIPCSNLIRDVNLVTKLSMFERTVLERLEIKARAIHQTYRSTGNDWEETCYRWLGNNFGFKVNSETFATLAANTPYKLILRSDMLLHVEALLFGQAGFLDEPYQDVYQKVLHQEYILLDKKFHLADRQMHKSQWRFLRLRPANFPTVRIAQFAAMLHRQKNIFSQIITVTTYRELIKIFEAEPSLYWRSHYRFAERTSDRTAIMGESSIINIIINSVVPILVAYGMFNDDQTYIDRAVNFLQELPADENNVIDQWRERGIEVKTAFDSQALIGLYNNYCLRRRCLSCNIGCALVRPAKR